MIELRYVGEFDKRLQIRQKVVNGNPKTISDTFIWGPWTDVPTVPTDSDKLPDKE